MSPADTLLNSFLILMCHGAIVLLTDSLLPSNNTYHETFSPRNLAYDNQWLYTRFYHFLGSPLILEEINRILDANKMAFVCYKCLLSFAMLLGFLTVALTDAKTQNILILFGFKDLKLRDLVKNIKI